MPLFADESMFQAVARATADAGPALLPIVLAAALLAVVAYQQHRATRRRVLLPAELTDLLSAIKYGAEPKRELEEALQKHDGTSPLVPVLRAALECRGRRYETGRAMIDQAIKLAEARFAKPTPWIDTIYSGSTLLGLTGSAIGLVAAFRYQAVAGADADPARLNATLAAAVLATALSNALALLSLGVGTVLRKREDDLFYSLSEYAEPLLRQVTREEPPSP